MTVSTATLTDSSSASADPKARAGARAWQRPLGVALLLAAAAMVWPGGWTALLGLLAAGLGVHLALKPAAPQAAAQHVPAVGGRVGAEVMVSEVVPVWSRQMEVTRDAATEGLSNILQVFTQMSDALYTLTQNLATFEISAEPGAVHEAVGREAQALNTLTAASQRAFDQRDAAVAELTRCSDALSELQQLAKQVREIARHTRLVAFNASIEANRQRGGGEGGS